MLHKDGFLALAVGALVVIFSGCGSGNRAQVEPALEKQVAGLRESLDTLSTDLASKSQLASVADDMRTIQKQVASCGSGNRAQVEPALEKQVAGLRESLDTLSTDLASKSQLASVADDMRTIQKQVASLVAEIGSVPVDGNALPPDTKAVEYHTTQDAKVFVSKLGKHPSAEKLADALATVDAWPVKSDQQIEMRKFKLELASQLRKQVKEEVIAIQTAALNADCGAKGAAKHAAAGRILALYPMSEDKTIIEEAKQLSAQQAELAVRLEVIRRQRYNHWAAEQVEKAILDYNNTKSRIPYRTDTDKLVERLVENMGAVDPALLEPAVLELYNYAFDLTRAALSEQEKIDLAKRMTDPSLKRKILGDF